MVPMFITFSLYYFVSTINCYLYITKPSTMYIYIKSLKLIAFFKFV